MKLRMPAMQLPILRKEMVEVAARKRTYIIRFVYAVALFAIWLLILWERYHVAGSDVTRLNDIGRELFSWLMLLELASIYLFLPAMVAGSITLERENKTMTLLLVTDLRPWEILVQKLVGRMLPVLTFLFLAMPLAGVAQLFGGIEFKQVANSVYVLVVTALQVGAAAVFVSTFCKSTVSALMVCYLVGPLIYLMAIIGNIVVGVLWMGVVFVAGSAFGMDGDFSSALMLNAFPPAVLSDPDQAFWQTVVFTVPTLLVSGLFVLMARDELVSGTLAMGPQAPISMQFTQTRSIPEAFRRDLPGDEPIAWRQGLGGPGSRSTIRVALGAALVLIVGFWAMSLTTGHMEASLGLLTFMGGCAWLAAGLVLLVLGSGPFAGERLKGTLDVLLATPLTGRQILFQKMQTARRWTIAFATVFLVIGALRTMCLLVESLNGDRPASEWVLYPVFAALAAAVYLRLAVWFSTWVGLTVSTHAKSSLMVLSVAGAWCVAWAALPPIVLGAMGLGEVGAWMALLSPMAVVWGNETFGWTGRGIVDWIGLPPAVVWATVLGQLGAYYAIGGALRRHCVNHIDHYLGRAAEGDGPIEPDAGSEGGGPPTTRSEPA